MTIWEFAKVPYNEAKGNHEEAVRLGMKMLREKPELMEEMIEDLLKTALDELARGETHRESQRAWGSKEMVPAWKRAARAIPSEPSESLQEGDAARMRDRLLELPLTGGKHLGDFTKAELRDLLGRTEANANAFAMRASFFRLIVRALKKDTDIVRDHLTEQRLLRYQKSIMEASAT